MPSIILPYILLTIAEKFDNLCIRIISSNCSAPRAATPASTGICTLGGHSQYSRKEREFLIHIHKWSNLYFLHLPDYHCQTWYCLAFSELSQFIVFCRSSMDFQSWVTVFRQCRVFLFFLFCIFFGSHSRSPIKNLLSSR